MRDVAKPYQRKSCKIVPVEKRCHESCSQNLDNSNQRSGIPVLAIDKALSMSQP